MHFRKSSSSSSSSVVQEEKPPASLDASHSIFDLPLSKSHSHQPSNNNGYHPIQQSLPSQPSKGPSLRDRFRLVSWADAPLYLQDNRFILTGYRANFSFSLCLYSLFRTHNESCNIWSHLAPIPFLIAASGFVAWHSFFGDQPDMAIILVYLVALTLSLCCSSVWHLFLCISKDAYVRLLQLDLSGVSLLVAASYYPPVYYNLRCFPRLQTFYLVTISFFSALGVIMPMIREMSTARWRKVRIALYGGMALFSLLPTVHTPFLLGWANSASLLALVFLSYLCYSIGLFHYATRFPESWKPGRFDIWGHSHTWWHVWCLVGSLVHLLTCWLSYKHRDFWTC